MKFGSIVIAVLSIVLATVKAANSSSLPATNVSAAVDGILAAFRDHPLVGIEDNHGLAQEEDFYAALMRDPRFAREVTNVVVEFGGAGRQNTLDRYLAVKLFPTRNCAASGQTLLAGFQPLQLSAT